MELLSPVLPVKTTCKEKVGIPNLAVTLKERTQQPPSFLLFKCIDTFTPDDFAFYVGRRLSNEDNVVALEKC